MKKIVIQISYTWFEWVLMLIGAPVIAGLIWTIVFSNIKSQFPPKYHILNEQETNIIFKEYQ